MRVVLWLILFLLVQYSSDFCLAHSHLVKMYSNKLTLTGRARLNTLVSDVLIIDGLKEFDIESIVSCCEIIGSSHAVR